MSVGDENRLIEHGMLAMVLGLHPEHLTVDELVLKLATGRDQAEHLAIEQAIRDLAGSGLLRHPGGVVEPTHAAVRANELLIWPHGAP